MFKQLFIFKIILQLSHNLYLKSYYHIDWINSFGTIDTPLKKAQGNITNPISVLWHKQWIRAHTQYALSTCAFVGLGTLWWRKTINWTHENVLHLLPTHVISIKSKLISRKWFSWSVALYSVRRKKINTIRIIHVLNTLILLSIHNKPNYYIMFNTCIRLNNHVNYKSKRELNNAAVQLD